LDGGLPKWLAEGGPVQSGPNDTNFKPVEYKSNYQDGLHCTFEQVLKQHNASPSTIIDARSSGRFNGTEPEPDPEIHSGHIVGSKNLFWQEFLDKNSKTLKSPEELQKVFTDNNVNLDVLNIATCGSGITACWITLAAQIINKDIPVYTGSWLEWYGKGPDRTKVLGIKG
jgi:thiosulfate/3-mercaptopyruvate sulfurtransferase